MTSGVDVGLRRGGAWEKQLNLPGVLRCVFEPIFRVNRVPDTVTFFL